MTVKIRIFIVYIYSNIHFTRYLNIHFTWYLNIQFTWYLNIHFTRCLHIHFTRYLNIHFIKYSNIHFNRYLNIHFTRYLNICTSQILILFLLSTRNKWHFGLDPLPSVQSSMMMANPVDMEPIHRQYSTSFILPTRLDQEQEQSLSLTINDNI